MHKGRLIYLWTTVFLKIIMVPQRMMLFLLDVRMCRLVSNFMKKIRSKITHIFFQVISVNCRTVTSLLTCPKVSVCIIICVTFKLIDFIDIMSIIFMEY